MVTQRNETQHETPAQRQDRMLHLAMLKNTTAERIPQTTIYRVRSDSTPTNVYYLTNGTICTCPWGHDHDTICSHAAFVRFLAEVEAPAPAMVMHDHLVKPIH